MSHEPEPEDAIADDAAADVEGHLFVPPDERGGGHPTAHPHEGRADGPNG